MTVFRSRASALLTSGLFSGLLLASANLHAADDVLNQNGTFTTPGYPLVNGQSNSGSSTGNFGNFGNASGQPPGNY